MALNLEDMNLAEMRERKANDLMDKLKGVSSDAIKIAIIRKAINEVKAQLAGTLKTKIEGKVELADIDKLKKVLEDELRAIFMPVLEEMKAMNMSSDKVDQLKDELDSKFQRAFEDRFQTTLIEKPGAIHRIENLDEIIFPDEVRINNLGELDTAFKNLQEVIKDVFNIDIPAPKVTVTNPNPKAPVVNVEPPDLRPLLEALRPLGLLSNKANKPISVRLSDGKGWLKKLVNAVKDQTRQVGQYVQASMSASDFKDAFLSVQKSNSVTEGRFVPGNDAGQQVTAASTPIDKVWLSADINRIAVGGSSDVSMATPKGVLLTPGTPPILMEISNLNLLYCGGATGVLCYAYLKR